MKKTAATVLCLLILALAACRPAGPKDPERFPAASAAPETGYTVRERTFVRDGLHISGEMLLPEDPSPVPLVVFCHGFGGNRENLRAYAAAFAEAGFAALIFDFIGGGKTIRSDGDPAEMSVLTEAADLAAVLESVRTDPEIDPERIFLVGESQGGWVSTFVASGQTRGIAGLVLLYPAFMLDDLVRSRIPDPDRIPERLDLMGMTVGARYCRDVLSVDIYQAARGYGGPVLILHGTSDTLVPVSCSERAVRTFPDAKLIRMEGAGHVFRGGDADKAARLALTFVRECLD